MKLTTLRLLMIFLIILLFRFITTLILGVFSMTDDANEINIPLNSTIQKILDFPLGVFEKDKWSVFLILLNAFIQSTLIILFSKLISRIKKPLKKAAKTNYN